MSDSDDYLSAEQHLAAERRNAYNSSLTEPLTTFGVNETRSKHFAELDWQRRKAAAAAKAAATKIQRFVRSRRTKKRASAAAEAKPASGQGGRKRRYRRGRTSRRSRR